MRQKFISMCTLSVFILFNLSCVSYKYESSKESIETVEAWQRWRSDEIKKIEILEIVNKSGERLEFAEGRPGIIAGDAIIGGARVKEESGEVTEIVSVSVPLSEVESVWVRVKRKDKVRSAFKTIGAIGLGIVAYWVIYFSTHDVSCPFIYSFDGENYIFDAEPYAGAVCRGVQRSEWCGLEHLKEVDGTYRLLVTNEVEETEYVDEIKLLVVDHPAEVRVVPGAWGKIHTAANPLPPIRAYDRAGRDLTSQVSENDRLLWHGRVEPREELVFEFPRPGNTAGAKLLVNGHNTLWGPESIKRYLGLYGSRLPAWYDEVDRMGPALFKMLNMHLREELYSLQIRVETAAGWQSKGLMVGGPPTIGETKAYPLDLTDVPGDTLRIKLTPPSPFWKINYLAVDYSEDLAVDVTEIAAAEAVSHTGEDVGKLLSQNDGHYMVMPDTGDSAELVFTAPPPNPGLDRTVILKASGYYDIHLAAEGEPQYDLLERIHSEPGFAVKHALKEYLKWQAEALEAIKQK